MKLGLINLGEEKNFNVNAIAVERFGCVIILFLKSLKKQRRALQINSHIFLRG